MNLNKKIKKQINEKKTRDTLLYEISKIKKKIVGFSNIDFELYHKLLDIEHSIYKYNNFLNNNMLNYAEKEIKNLMNLYDENTATIKGGRRNIKYIWRTESNDCEKCRELNGTEYNNKENIPEKPHPNCKCQIEEVKDNDELCNCYKFFDNIDDVLHEAKYLQNKVYNEKEDINRVVDKYLNSNSNSIQKLINDIISLENPLSILYQTISIFLVNYYKMRDADTHGADKYFHAKANCEAAQRGIVGEMIAKAISDLREFVDIYKNIHIKKYTIEESIKDIQEDLEANQEGRDLGRKYPTENSYELLKHRIPNGFPDRYKGH